MVTDVHHYGNCRIRDMDRNSPLQNFQINIKGLKTQKETQIQQKHPSFSINDDPLGK
jgi:hypothetical protein